MKVGSNLPDYGQLFAKAESYLLEYRRQLDDTYLRPLAILVGGDQFPAPWPIVLR